MASPAKHNLFTDPVERLDSESFETIIASGKVRLERIVSYGQATPSGTWLEQQTNEWVVVLSGSGRLAFAESEREITMFPGDHIVIPAGCRHRVTRTDPNGKTVWLAFHFPAQRPQAIKAVKVIRTRRRSRSASARMVNDTLYVRVPYRISDDDVRSIVQELSEKVEKKLLRRQLNTGRELESRARELNKRYFAGKLRLDSIEYVTDQNAKFGCCDYERRKIRIAHHVACMPAWVRDYVLVHELAHLVHPDHGPDFWGLVSQYRHMERAKGYLLAKGYELNDETEQA